MAILTRRRKPTNRVVEGVHRAGATVVSRSVSSPVGRGRATCDAPIPPCIEHPIRLRAFLPYPESSVALFDLPIFGAVGRHCSRTGPLPMLAGAWYARIDCRRPGWMMSVDHCRFAWLWSREPLPISSNAPSAAHLPDRYGIARGNAPSPTWGGTPKDSWAWAADRLGAAFTCRGAGLVRIWCLARWSKRGVLNSLG